MSYNPPLSDDVGFDLESAPAKPSDTVDFNISEATLATAQSTASVTASSPLIREKASAPAGSTTTVDLVTPALNEQRSQSVSAGATLKTEITQPVPDLSALLLSSISATTATTTSRELFVSAVSAQSTAVETKTRFFKFARAQATSSTQVGTGRRSLVVDSLTDVSVSPLASFTLIELTANRRSIDGAGSTDAVFQQPTDTVEYEDSPDGVEYDT